MLLGLHYCGYADGRDHAELFDYVCSGPAGRHGDESGKPWWGRSFGAYTGVGPQEQWLALSPALVPGKPGTWQYYNNPVSLGTAWSLMWRLPQQWSLYGLGNEQYAATWAKRACDWADALNAEHGALVQGIFTTDSLVPHVEWMWCGLGEMTDEDWQARCKRFCEVAYRECHKRGYWFAGPPWAGLTDMAWIEHCRAKSSEKGLALDMALEADRRYRLAVHVEGESAAEIANEIEFWRGVLGPNDVAVVSQLDVERLGIDVEELPSC